MTPLDIYFLENNIARLALQSMSDDEFRDWLYLDQNSLKNEGDTEAILACLPYLSDSQTRIAFEELSKIRDRLQSP